MFGIGWSELLILIIIGLVFIGPKELPQVIKTVSRFMKQIMGARDEWIRTIKDDPTIRDLTDSVTEMKDSINAPVSDLEKALRENISKLENEVLKAEDKKLEPSTAKADEKPEGRS